MTPVGDNPGRTRLRSIMYDVGDCQFLVIVGILVIVATRLIHELGWGFAITCGAGMAAAMAVQAMLAFSVAPILGSIETMTSSMVVAMATSMSVCGLHLIGRELSWPGYCGLGAAVGAGMFIFVVTYGRACKKSLRRAFSGREGR